MASQPPQDFNEFVLKYTPRIISYIKQKNKINSTKLDPSDFVQDILLKFKEEKTLEKFNPDRGASFDTWFYRILFNCFSTTIRHKADEEKKIGTLPEDYEQLISNPVSKGDLYSYLNGHNTTRIVPQEMKQIVQVIEEIPDVRERLSVKLKAYPLLVLHDKELSFMSEQTGIENNRLRDALDKMYKTKAGGTPGLKDKDVAKLLGYASFTTQRDRVVRKYLLPQYIYMKNRGKL